MPTDRHLEVIEITDFAPGYWSTGGALLIPAQGWQEMKDCRPEPGGGVRAAFKPTLWDVTTVHAGTNLNRSTSVVLNLLQCSNSERYLWLYNQSDGKINVYSWNGTDWTLVVAHTGSTGFTKPIVLVDTFLVTASGVDYVVYTINQNGDNSTQEGLWSINRTSKANVHESTAVGASNILCVMDDILVCSNGGRTLYYSTSGTMTMDTATRFIVVQGSRFNAGLTGALYSAPSDLMLGTSGSVWSLVQGDIAASPTVRSMSDAHPLTGVQQLHQTPLGICFIETGRGIFVTGDGNAFESLASQIDRSTWAVSATPRTPGVLAVAGDFILAPHGLCMDIRTKAWFRLSDLVTNDNLMGQGYRRDGVLVTATPSTSFNVYQYDTTESSLASTYTLKTAPFRSQDGRRIKIRQVQVTYRSYHSGDTIAVTVNGTTRTVTITAAENGEAVFLFKEHGEYLDVQIVSTADTGSHQAPDIEAVRIGKVQTHRAL